MKGFKKFITENPDRVSSDVWWRKNDALTFGYVKGKFFISDKVTNHPDFAMDLVNKKLVSITDVANNRYEVSRTSFKFPGRLWTKSKIVSFWEYPDKNQFDKFIDDCKKNGIIIDKTWKIDIEDGPTNHLEPVTDYSNKLKDVKVTQVQHLIDPIAKNLMKKAGKGVTMNSKKINLPKGINSFAQYRSLAMTSENVNESHVCYKLGSMAHRKGESKKNPYNEDNDKEKYDEWDKGYEASKNKMVENMSDHYIVKCSNCDKIMKNCRCSSPHKEVKYDLCDTCKNMKNEDASTVAPSSVSTGQHQTKLGEPAERETDDFKKKVKKKIKKKLHEVSGHGPSSTAPTSSGDGHFVANATSVTNPTVKPSTTKSNSNSKGLDYDSEGDWKEQEEQDEKIRQKNINTFKNFMNKDNGNAK